MTVFEMLKELGIPVAYGSFTEEVKAPFLVYYFDEPDIVHADNINYYKNRKYVVEYYFTKKDLELEDKLEDLLTRHDVAFTQSGDIWIDSENIWVNYIYF